MRRTVRLSSALTSAWSIAIVLILIVLGVSRPTPAQQSTAAKPPSKSDAGAGSIARGRYLVEEVAVCGNCHTPRDPNGQLDRTRPLSGTPLFFQPAHQMADWPIVAPRIGGTPAGTDDEMITLLTTGIWKTGKPLRQPMPRFHFTREDAQAIVAYLRSLSTVQ